ncbi:MAG TPA: hypothetical protein VK574_05660 [Terracidiphilus sp.]|nr:hypothetical protein [Terracidiphilus sp.]
MNRKFPEFSSSRTLLVASALIGCGLTFAAQQPPMPNADAQREAMKKLAFLAGKWSGPVSISRGPGEPLHLAQAEIVQFKLDGLVMLVEGQSTGPDGKAQFQALASIAYDDSTHTYRFRAYNEGHYLDTELSVQPDGFVWGFTAGPAKIENTMHLTAKGEWQETTDVTFGNNPPHRSVDMLLQHQP